MLTETRRHRPPYATTCPTARPQQRPTRIHAAPDADSDAAPDASFDADFDGIRDRDFDPEEALGDLYTQHARALLSYAERFTGDRGRAEDIVQETFLRAWRNLPTLLDDDRPVRPWLLRVARRLLIDAARAARIRPAVLDDGPSLERAVDGGFDQVLDQAVLLDAVQRLSKIHQDIVIETFFLDRPVHLAAARLGVPAGTARSRLHNALVALRRQLDYGDPAA